MIIREIRPRLIERECGGWLAVSPPEAALQIGVTGKSEAEAVRAYTQALRLWTAALLDEPERR
jgi:predicted RNase H-like HicB family nuclease